MQNYVEQAQVSGAFTVTVVGVEGESVDVCAGENGDVAWTATLVDGKVAENVKGDHTC